MFSVPSVCFRFLFSLPILLCYIIIALLFFVVVAVYALLCLSVCHMLLYAIFIAFKKKSLYILCPPLYFCKTFFVVSAVFKNKNKQKKNLHFCINFFAMSAFKKTYLCYILFSFYIFCYVILRVYLLKLSAKSSFPPPRYFLSVMNASS